MPYLSNTIWSEVIAYLPKEERKQAAARILQLEKEYAQRQLLTQQQFIPPDIIYFKQLTKDEDHSFTVISAPLHQSPLNTYKFHISIFPLDYKSVLENSKLNRELQKCLASISPITITRFKYANLDLLRAEKETSLQVRDYLNIFYNAIYQYNSAVDPKDPELRLLINTSYEWWLNNLHSDLPMLPLNSLFISTQLTAEQQTVDLEKIQAHHQKQLDYIQSVIESENRAENEIQYTLYPHLMANSSDLIHLIQQIDQFLTRYGVRSNPCPVSELPLTRFVTFRQDRFSIDSTYIDSFEEEALVLKEIARDSTIYKTLYNGLNPGQSNEKVSAPVISSEISPAAAST